MITILAYLYIAKTRILVNLAYRFEVFSAILTNFILMISTVFFWKVAYNGINEVSGVNLEQMITYSIITALLGTLFIFNVENVVIERIREGDIAVDFIKPVNVFGIYFAQDIGNIVSSFIQRSLPLLLFAVIFIKPPLPKSFLHFAVFLACSFLSFFILWFLSAIIGVLAFWVIDFGPMGFVKDVIVKILSGSIIPIWFFPEHFQSVLRYLPFIYTFQLPAGVYIGKIGLREAANSMLIQLLWVLLLFSLFYFMQRKAKKKLVSQGG